MMTKEEFLFEITKLCFSDDDIKSNVVKILYVIRDYFGASKCVWKRSKRKEDIIQTDGTMGNKVFNIGTLELHNPPKMSSKLYEIAFLLEYIKNLDNIINLYETAYHDSLTNIFNNNALYKRIYSNEVFHNAGVIFIDANDLGVINNVGGHEAGDEMLKTIAKVINSNFRKNEIYRKGGDEFVVIANNISNSMFHEKVEKIRNAMKETKYSISLGSVYKENINNIRELIDEADAKMYEEKTEYHKNSIDKHQALKNR